MTSLSTRFFGQPRDTKPTLGRVLCAGCWDGFESVGGAETSKGAEEVTKASLPAFARHYAPVLEACVSDAGTGKRAEGRASNAGWAKR